MKREKVLVNFRTFKAYKTALDKLSEKAGMSVTQYMNNLLLEKIINDILDVALHTALLSVLTKEKKLPLHFQTSFKNDNSGFWKEAERILGKDDARALGSYWKDCVFRFIEIGRKNYGIEENDVEYAELMKAFSEKVQDRGRS
jgi:hypothetical protein